jgi:hypothetical protein
MWEGRSSIGSWVRDGGRVRSHKSESGEVWESQEKSGTRSQKSEVRSQEPEARASAAQREPMGQGQGPPPSRGARVRVGPKWAIDLGATMTSAHLTVSQPVSH